MSFGEDDVIICTAVLKASAKFRNILRASDNFTIMRKELTWRGGWSSNAL